MKNTITRKTLIEVKKRDKGRCIICGTKWMLERVPHHCFFKSEYFGDDRNRAWNLVTICMVKEVGNKQETGCHRKIHYGNKQLERLCKTIALNRYSGKHKNKLLKIMKEKGFNLNLRQSFI